MFAERAKVAELVEGLGALLKWAEWAETTIDAERGLRDINQIEADGDLSSEIMQARALIERIEAMTDTEIFFTIIAFLFGFAAGQWVMGILARRLIAAQREYIAMLKGEKP